LTIERPDTAGIIEFLGPDVAVIARIEGGKLEINVKVMHGEGASTWDEHDFEVDLEGRETPAPSPDAGKGLWLVRHEHRHGVSAAVVCCSREPTCDEAVAALSWDWEKDRDDETVEVERAGPMPWIP
jgi:hypothetical protein